MSWVGVEVRGYSKLWSVIVPLLFLLSLSGDLAEFSGTSFLGLSSSPTEMSGSGWSVVSIDSLFSGENQTHNNTNSSIATPKEVPEHNQTPYNASSLIPIEELVQEGNGGSESAPRTGSACERLGFQDAYCVQKEETLQIANYKDQELELGKIYLNKTEVIRATDTSKTTVIETHARLQNLTNVRIKDTEFEGNGGSIEFDELILNVGVGGVELSEVFTIEHNLIGLDSEKYPQFNEPAHLVFTGMAGFSGASPLRNGEPCGPEYCTNLTYDYENGIFEMDVSGFSNYSYGGDANLTVYTEYDGGAYYPINANIWFYANYTNNSVHIGSSTCNLTLDNGSSYLMTDTGSQYSYQVPYAYTTLGAHSYNIKCNKTGYDTLNASEYFEVAYQIKDCGTLTNAGQHYLSQNLSGAGQAVSGITVSTACIVAAADGINFDCNGYSIVNGGTADAAGIVVKTISGTEYDTLLVENCPEISGYEVGFYIDNSHGNQIRNSTIHTADTGVYVDDSEQCIIDTTTIYNTSDNYGIYLTGNQDINITDSTIYDNEGGFRALTTNNTLIKHTVFYNNSYDLNAQCLTSEPRIFTITESVFLNPYGTYVNYTNFSLYDEMGVKTITLNWSDGTASFPANTGTFHNKFLYINTSSDTAIDKMVWHWTDAELSGYTESALALWKYDSGPNAWYFLPFVQSTSTNEITIYNYEADGIYGILENSSCSKIDTSGSYQLTSNVEGAPVSGDVSGYGSLCFKIASSNVDFDCNGHTITNDATENASAFMVEGSDGVNYTNVTVRNSPSISGYRAGVFFYKSEYDYAQELTIEDGASGSSVGIYIYETDDCEISDVNISGMASAGTRISNSATSNELTDVQISDSFRGFYVYGAPATYLYRPSTYNNSYDVMLNNPLVSSMVVRAYNATFKNPAGTSENNTMLSLIDSVVSGERYFLNWTSTPASVPTGTRSFGDRYVEMENISATATIGTATWRWTDAEAVGYDEDKFRLWTYSSGWSMVAGATLDTTANTMTMTDVPLHSDYGILETNATSCMIINQEGEYELSDDVSGASISVVNPKINNACFVIEADNVTLDCQGNSIINNGTASAAAFYINGTTPIDYTNVTLQNCEIKSYDYGALLFNTSNDSIVNTTLYNNSVSIYLSETAYSEIQESTIYNSTYGVYSFDDSTHINISDSIVHSCTAEGVHAEDNKYFYLVRGKLYNNTIDLKFERETATPMSVYVNDTVFLNPLGTYLNYTNLSLYDSMDVGDYLIKWDQDPGSTPSYSQVFHDKFLNITDTSGTVSIDQVVWTWTTAEESGFNVDALEVWEYNSSGSWQSIGSVLDTGARTLTVDSLSPHSTYGIFESNQSQSACFNADTPNMLYQLTQDLEGAPLLYGSAQACIIINASNVTIDCNGFDITNNGTAGYTYGIVTNTTINATEGDDLENIVLQNCDVSGYDTGIGLIGHYYSGGSVYINTHIEDSLIENTTAFNNSNEGLYFYRVRRTIVNDTSFYNNTNGTYWVEANNNAVDDSLIYDNADHGSYLMSGIVENTHNNTFYDIVFHDNGIGMYQASVYDTNIYDSVFENDTIGIRMDYADYGHAQRLNFTNASGAHIYMNTSEYNEFFDLREIDGAYGVYFAENANNNTFNGTFLEQNTYGYYFDDAHGNELNYSDISDYTYGVYLLESNYNHFDNLSTRNGSVNGITLEAASTNRIHNVVSSNNSFNGIVLLERETDYNNISFGGVYNNSKNGIYAEQAAHNRFTFLNVHNNSLNGFMSQQADYNTVTNSDFNYHGNSGLYFNDTSSGNYVGRTRSNNAIRGVTVYSSDSNTFEEVNVTNSSGNGVNLVSSEGTIMNESYVLNSSTHGILVSASEETNIDQTNVSDASYGIYVESGSHNTSIYRSTVFDVQTTGIAISNSDDQLVHTSYIYNNGVHGLFATSGTGIVMFHVSSHDNGDKGMLWDTFNDVYLWSSEIYNNPGYGVESRNSGTSSSEDVVLDTTQFYNNSLAVVFNNTGTKTFHEIGNCFFMPKNGALENYTMFSDEDDFSEATAAYSYNWSHQVAPIGFSYVSFRQKFINVTPLLGTATVDEMVWTWYVSEETGYDEDYFRLLRYNPSSPNNWSILIAPVLDTSANTITWTSVNVPLSTESSDVYGIFQDNGSSCRVFDSPGEYVLANNVSGAPIDVSDIGYSLSKACFVINTDNFTLDCNGYGIYNPEGINYVPNAVAILVNGSTVPNKYSNITVKNCLNAYNYSVGTYTLNSTNIRWDNMTVEESDITGLAISGTSSVNVTNSRYWKGVRGITISDSKDVLVNDSSATQNSFYGIGMDQNTQSTIISNSGLTYNGQMGIRSSGAHNGSFVHNSIYENSKYGIELLNSYDNRVENHTIIRKNGIGILIDGSQNNWLINNTIYNNTGGIEIKDSNPSAAIFRNMLINQHLYNNTICGLNVSSSSWALADKSIIEENTIGVEIRNSEDIYVLSHYSATSAYDGPDTEIRNNSQVGVLVEHSDDITMDSFGAHTLNLTKNGFGGSGVQSAMRIYNSTNFTLAGFDWASSVNVFDNYFAVYVASESPMDTNHQFVRVNIYENSGTALSITDSDRITVGHSNFYNQDGQGIGLKLDNSDYCSVYNISTHGNNRMGISLTEFSRWNDIVNSTSFANGWYGLYVSRAYSNLTNFTFYNNSLYDAYFTHPSGAIVPSQQLNEVFFLNPSGTLENYTKFSMFDMLVSGDQYSINWTQNSSPLPDDYVSFRNKWINISVHAGDPTISQAVWHWTDAETAGYEEYRLSLVKYNASDGWTILNSTPSIADNELTYYTFQPGSDYGILQNNGSCQIINVSGTYTLNTNASGAPYDLDMDTVTNVDRACIIIEASNVVLDCNGYSIINDGTLDATAIAVNGSGGPGILENITIANCSSVKDYENGFTSEWYQYGSLRNSTFQTSTYGGVVASRTREVLFTNLTTKSNDVHGLLLTVASRENNVTDLYSDEDAIAISAGISSNYNRFDNIIADSQDTAGTGVYFLVGNNNTVANSVFNYFGTTFGIATSNSSVFENITIYNTENAYVFSNVHDTVTRNTTIENCTTNVLDYEDTANNQVYELTATNFSGIAADLATSNYTIFQDIYFSNPTQAAGGFYLDGDCDYNNITNLTVINVSAYGAYIGSGSDGNRLENSTLNSTGLHNLEIEIESLDNVIHNNHFDYATGYGLQIANSTAVITDNIFTNSGFNGIEIVGCGEVNISNNLVYDITMAGINMRTFTAYNIETHVVGENNTIYSCGDPALGFAGSTYPMHINLTNLTLLPESGVYDNYTVFDLNDDLAVGDDYQINWSTANYQYGAYPDSYVYRAFHYKVINITAPDATPGTIDQIIWRWTDAEVVGYDENDLRLLRTWGASSYNVYPETPDIATNTLTKNNIIPTASTSRNYGLYEKEFNCLEPQDDLYINVSTYLCEGWYDIEDAGDTGVVIFNNNDIDVVCLNNNVTINGTGTGSGFYLPGNSSAGRGNNVRLINCSIERYQNGIYMYPEAVGGEMENNTLYHNTVNNSDRGIMIHAQKDDLYRMVVANNTLLNSSDYGIYLYSYDLSGHQYSYDITNNTIEDTPYGVYMNRKNYYHNFTYNNFTNISSFAVSMCLGGSCNAGPNEYESTWQCHVGPTNTINGSPIYHYFNHTNEVFADLDLTSDNQGTNTGLFSCIKCENITFKNNNLDSAWWGGAVFFGNVNVTIQNNDVSNSNKANENYGWPWYNVWKCSNIAVYNSTDAIVRNNNASSSKLGILALGRYGAGFPTNYNYHIHNNSIYNVSVGIELWNNLRGNIYNNTVWEASDAAIRINKEDYSNVTDNLVYGSEHGIHLFQDAEHNNVVYNEVYNMSSSGIRFRTTGVGVGGTPEFNVIENNTITNADQGMHFYTGRYNNITTNDINDTTYGIYFAASGTSIPYNNFTGNQIYNASDYGVRLRASTSWTSGSLYPLRNYFACENYYEGEIFCSFYDVHNATFEDYYGSAWYDGNSTNDATDYGMITILDSTNFSMTEMNLSDDREYGLQVFYSDNITIRNSNLSDNGDATTEANIQFYGSWDGLVVNTTTNNGPNGIRVSGNYEPSQYTELHNNTINNASIYGIEVDGVDYVTIQNNTMRDNVIHIATNYQVDYLTISQNQISGGDYGIYLNEDEADPINYPTITDNNVENVSSTGYYIYSHTTSNAVQHLDMRRNNVTNATYGMYVQVYNPQTYFHHNLIDTSYMQDVDYGLYIRSYSYTINPQGVYNNTYSNFDINATVMPVYIMFGSTGTSSPVNHTLINFTLRNDVASDFYENEDPQLTNINFTNITLHRNFGSIYFNYLNWEANKSIKTENTILNSDIASINSTYHTYFQSEANVTLYSYSCPAAIYWKTGFPTTAYEIATTGSYCPGGRCYDEVCASNLVNFTVSNFSGYTANITDCQIITTPGTYTLNSNAYGAPNDASEVYGIDYACIKIATSDVVLDCDGMNFTNTGVANASAIVVNGSATNIYTNITISNCPKTDGYKGGIHYYYGDGGAVSNLSLSNSTYPLWLNETDNINVSDSTLYNATYSVLLDATDNIFLDNITAFNSTKGLYSPEDSSTTLINSQLYSFTTAIDLLSSTSPNLTSNQISNSTFGIHLASSTDALIYYNNLSNNTQYGVYLDGATDATLYNNRITLSDEGLVFLDATGTLLYYNIFYNNEYAFVAEAGTGSDFYMFNDSFRPASGATGNYTVLQANDSMGAGESYFINWTTNATSIPATYTSFANKYLNISTLSGTPSVDEITWIWNSGELGSYSEGKFELWNYTSSWGMMNNTPNTTTHTLTLYALSPDGLYGILERSNVAPYVDNLVLNSTWDTNYTTENLTVWYDVHDADSEPVYNITNWFMTNSSVTNQSLMVLNMPFEGGSNSTWTQDYSPYGNNGTVSGATWNATGGYDGWGAYEFDGSTSYINAGADSSLEPPTMISFGAWVNVKGAGTHSDGNFVISKGRQGTAPYMSYAMDYIPSSGVYTCYVSSGSTRYSATSTTTFGYTDGWAYIACTYDGEDLRIYVNGTQEDETEVTGTIRYGLSTDNDLHIGDWGYSTYTRRFQGLIDQVQIWNRSISPQQVELLYNNEKDTIHYRETRQDEVWQAGVTPNDGTEAGLQNFSNTLQIARLGVENASIASTSGNNYSDDNLTLSYDLFNGSETGIVNWYVDEVPLLNIYFPFEAYDGDAPTVAKDYSPFSLNGTLTDVTWNATGHDGKPSYSFESGTANIRVDDSGMGADSPLNVDKFTIEVWAKPSDIPSSGLDEMVSKVQYGGFGFGIATNGRLYLRAGIGSTTQDYVYSSNGQVVNDEWQHFVGTYDGDLGELKVYINGSLNGTATYAGSYDISSGDFCIGEQTSSSACSDGDNYEGEIGLVRFWNRTMTAEQIQMLYENVDPTNISSTETNYEEVWKACVLAHGDWEDSLNPESCGNITIELPPPPIVENVTLNSTFGTNLTTENLTVYYDSFSPEGYEVKNMSTWFLTNSTVTNMSIMTMFLTFEGGSEAQRGRDYTSYEHNVVAVSSLPYYPTGGYDGWGSYACSASTTAFAELNSSAMDGLQDFTIMMWVNRSYATSTNDRALISAAGASSSNEFFMYLVNSNTMRIAIRGAEDNFGGFTLNQNEWTHMAFKRTGDQGEFFVNGVSMGTATVSSVPLDVGGCAGTQPAPSGFVLCQEQDACGGSFSSSQAWVGMVDDLRIYNMSLSSDQITAISQNVTDVIVSQETEVDDTWQSCVWANDGIQASLVNCSNNLTIRNYLPPLVENITLNSTFGTNYTTENLTVWYDTYDPQGFDVYNVTNWFLTNGTVTNQSIMVLNMPFEGSDATSTWTRDYTPYGNNGTVSGATWLPNGGFDGYGAYEFDGTSSYIRPPPSIIQPNTVLTIEARFKTTDDGVIIGYQNADIPSGPSQYVPIMYVGSDGKLRAEMYMGSANPITTTGTVNDGEWHHAVLVADSTIQYLYLDGSQVGSLSGTINNLAMIYNYIGVVRTSTSWPGAPSGLFYFDGTIDSVRIYNRSITPEQVSMLFNNMTDSISWNETEIGETWQACITPNNGYMDGEQNCSNNLTIRDEPEGCQIISSPGTYTLTENAVGAPNTIYTVPDITRACIIIASSDVEFSCDGYNITNDGTADAAAVLINGTTAQDYTNVSVRNCPAISQYEKGVYIYNSSDDELRNSTTQGNTQEGLLIRYSDYSTILNLTSYNNTYGMYLEVAEHTNVEGSYMHNNTDTGFYTYRSNNTNFTSVAGYNNTQDGIYINDSYGIIIDPSSFHDNNANGVNLNNCEELTIDNVTVNDNKGHGLHLVNTEAIRIINSEFCRNHQYGIRMHPGTNTNLTSSLVCNNTQFGVYLEDSTQLTVVNATMYGNPTGVGSYHSSDSRIDPSYFYNNTVGINVTDTEDVVIDDTYIYNNTYGIYISGSNNTQINRSSIYNNTNYGVYQTNSNYTNSTNTNMTYNGIAGIYLDSNSESNTLNTNYVCFNGVDINNASDYTSGSDDVCDNWIGWGEDGHPGCTYRCTDIWHTFYGDAGGDLVLAQNADATFMYNWTGTAYNVYALNTLKATTVDWNSLIALGRNESIQPSANDFSEADTLLNLPTATDDIENLYSTDGSTPRQTINRELWRENVQYIPIANSTNYSAFVTGIVWDNSTDTDNQFSLTDNETLVFTTPVNLSTSGAYGTYDYEIRLPDTLDTYVPTSTTATIYVELI